MWRATLAVLCVCITIGPPTVHGWDVQGRLELYSSVAIGNTRINFTLVSKISTEFLQGVRFTIGQSVVEKKVVVGDWERLDDGLFCVHVIHTVATILRAYVTALPLLSPGYHPAFCWQPIHARVVASTVVVKIGEPRTLTCVTLSNASDPATYKWYKSPGPTDYIHIGQQFELAASNIHEGGAYSCGVQNECGKTKKSPVINVYIEVPFLVEEKTPPTAVTKDNLSFNITISGNHLHSPTIQMLDDTEEPTIQSRDIEGNFHYGQRKAKLFTMRWNVSETGNWTCYNTSKRVNGEYILRVMFRETEKQVIFKVDMECGTKKSPYHSVLGTGIGIGAGIILVVVLVVVAGYFIKKKMTKEQVDEINLIPG